MSALGNDDRECESSRCPSESTPGDQDDATSTRSLSGQWPQLALWECAVVGVPILLVGAMLCLYLPQDICFGDNGEFQLASATLGVMHPPGYPGLTTLGYLVSLLPVANKPLLISLATLGSGMIVLWFCALLQMRLGLHALGAVTTTLLFAAHRRFWFNVVAPEVYMPALMFLVVAAYLLLRYAQLGKRRDLLWSAVCLGICMSNRPPALLTIPFFAVAYWWAAGGLGHSITRRGKGLALAAVFAVIPILYSFGYVLIRDSTSTSYNYIEQHNAGHRVLPDASQGLTARVRRAVWLFTAEQFQPEFGTTLAGLRSKLRWFRHDLLYGQPVRLVLAGLTVLGGLVLCFRRRATAAWLLLGMMFHSFLFICIYRIYGQAADLSPFVFASVVLIGVALSPLAPRIMSRKRVVAVSVLALAVVVAVWRSADLPRRWAVARDADAVPFLTELDPATLPSHALVLTGWSHAVPLWYALHATVDRPDIEVFADEMARWDALCRAAGDRPVLAVHEKKTLDGRPLEPYRNIWRVTPPRGSVDSE